MSGRRWRLLTAAGLTVLPPASYGVAQDARPPVARVVPRIDTSFGDIRRDDYAWLRGREDPQVIRYLEAENRHTDAVLLPTRGLQDSLYTEMVGRIKETDETVPEREGEFWYFSRTEAGRQYPSLYRARRDGPRQLLLDQNQAAEGKRYYRVGDFRVSPDARLAAFSVDTSGAELYTVRVKDLRSGRLLADRIPNVVSGLEWAADNGTLFYVRADSAQRPYRLYRHVLGTDAAADALIYEERDPVFNLELRKTRSSAFLLVTLEAFGSTEVRYLPAARPDAPLAVVEPRRADLEYSVEHAGSTFFVLTNDSAPNFRLMRVPTAAPSRAHWRPVLPASDSVMLERMDAFRHHLVLYERAGGLQQIEVFDLRGGRRHRVAFDEPLYALQPQRNPAFDTQTLRFRYASLVVPSSVYDYDMRRRTRVLRKREEIRGGYDPARYAQERTFATAEDGTRVPVSLVYRAPLVRDGRRPMLLYAYGSYGYSMDPWFRRNAVSLLDRGFVYAIAHVRGGQELGRAWYDQGKLLAKRNSFTDFIAAAEMLTRQRYTSREHLAIQGESAGGLLMGAVVNMRPDLFGAAVMGVPFVDVINTMLDASIPLTAQEWKQWGDPHDSTYYAYMRSYSPYDNIRAQSYPSLLVTAGLNDPRVGYWEPAKWTAKLRATKTDANPLLLRTNMGAGHGGASGRYDALREEALIFAFVVRMVGAGGRPGTSHP